MEYTIKKMGDLAGVSTRTLRYYDEIGLLTPSRINSSGYRIYGQNEVDRLQQIMFYRELGVELELIKELLTSKSFDKSNALRDHHKKLLERREQIDALIKNIEKTIEHEKGGLKMKDKEKFEGFKKKLVDDNEKKYGKEIREKYGDNTVEASNKKFLNMTEEQHNEFEKLSQDVLDTLEKAFNTGDPAGELGQKAADLHRQWLSYTWGSYNKEAHAGLAQMYVDDERFTQYYDKTQPGLAKFLRDAVHIYTQNL